MVCSYAGYPPWRSNNDAQNLSAHAKVDWRMIIPLTLSDSSVVRRRDGAGD